jgi:hypothetical protein
MKFVLVTFRKPDLSRKGRLAETGYQYPKPFSSAEVHTHGRGPLYDTSTMFETPSGRAECLISLPDRKADLYAVSTFMSILSPVGADAWVMGNVSVQASPEYLVDEPTINAVRTRLAAGLVLDAKELEMIDPDHPRSGIRRTDRTKESLLRRR